jgi:hypothetical protein
MGIVAGEKCYRCIGNWVFEVKPAGRMDLGFWISDREGIAGWVRPEFEIHNPQSKI